MEYMVMITIVNILLTTLVLLKLGALDDEE